MTTKKQFIDYINATKKGSLTIKNTSFSSINKSKNVWWLNIAVDKFKTEVNLLLKVENGVFWIVLPVGFVESLENTFKVRKDKNAVDLEINAGSNNFLCDVKSGGTGFDFNGFVKDTIRL